MKKFFILLLLFSIFLFPISASAEFSQMLHFSPLNWQKFSFDESNCVKNASDAELSGFSAFCIEISARFYFLPLNKHIDLGCGFNLGLGLPEYKAKNLPNRPQDLSGLSIFASAGPSIRYNFNEKNSLAFSPMLLMNFIEFGDYTSETTNEKTSFSGSGLFLSMNFAYKRWLLNTSAIHLGVNAGIDIAFPLKSYLRADFNASAYHSSEDYILYRADYGILTRVFLGVCINFGDRSIDRY